MAPRLAILITSAVLTATPALAQTERRGPFPSRDEWMLAQPLLTLPATSPDPLARGRYEVRVDGDWGSDFAVVGGSGIALSDPSTVGRLSSFWVLLTTASRTGSDLHENLSRLHTAAPCRI